MGKPDVQRDASNKGDEAQKLEQEKEKKEQEETAEQGEKEEKKEKDTTYSPSPDGEGKQVPCGVSCQFGFGICFKRGTLSKKEVCNHLTIT